MIGLESLSPRKTQKAEHFYNSTVHSYSCSEQFFYDVLSVTASCQGCQITDSCKNGGACVYDEEKQTYSCKCKPTWTGETCAELGKNNFEQQNEDGKVLSVKLNTTQNICLRDLETNRSTKTRKTKQNKTELFKREVKQKIDKNGKDIGGFKIYVCAYV